uniref:Uncharacterized protein n=1 Tax=Physcomitrium patens TaxID=3218 RepID=A0A2K1ICC8_PHYPA|nr:hypothetical protein PHYPA_030414 [Physcomitrium patens]
MVDWASSIQYTTGRSQFQIEYEEMNRKQLELTRKTRELPTHLVCSTLQPTGHQTNKKAAKSKLLNSRNVSKSHNRSTVRKAACYTKTTPTRSPRIVLTKPSPQSLHKRMFHRYQAHSTGREANYIQHRYHNRKPQILRQTPLPNGNRGPPSNHLNKPSHSKIHTDASIHSPGPRFHC